MFTAMKNRINAAESIMNTLKYLKDDATSSMEIYVGNTDDWSKEQYDVYAVQLAAIDCVEQALLKFVKTEK